MQQRADVGFVSFVYLAFCVFRGGSVVKAVATVMIKMHFHSGGKPVDGLPSKTIELITGTVTND